jgi:hypothetical protein
MAMVIVMAIGQTAMTVIARQAFGEIQTVTIGTTTKSAASL